MAGTVPGPVPGRTNRVGTALRPLAVAALSAGFLLLVASVLVFALVRSAPGDPVGIQFGESGAAAYLSPQEEAAARAERRTQLGLDGSLAEQYVRWLTRVARADLGTSYRSGLPVTTEVGARLPATVMLGTAGFAVAVIFAWGIAVLSVRRPGGWCDQLLRLGSLTAAAVPTFLSGSLALRIAADRWGYQVAGPATWERLWLPALVLGIAVAPTLARVLRVSILTEKGQTYALAARARGTSPARVLWRHVMRPAATPVLTLAGLALASLIGGAVITEVVFSWPGVGAYAVGAVAAKDYAVVQAYVLVTTLVVVLVNRGVDLLQTVLDPRSAHRTEAVA